MKRAFELSKRARRSFDQIRAFSEGHFGPSQTRFYLNMMLERCQSVADGVLPHQSCRTFFADDLKDDLRFVRAGQHFVIFLDRGERIVIVDFLHQRADVTSRLGGYQE